MWEFLGGLAVIAGKVLMNDSDNEAAVRMNESNNQAAVRMNDSDNVLKGVGGALAAGVIAYGIKKVTEKDSNNQKLLKS